MSSLSKALFVVSRTPGRLLRSPGTNLVAVLSLAVAVGCSAAAFSVADPIFLRPLPYTQPDSLFSLGLAPEVNGSPGRLNLADLSALKTLPGVRAVAFRQKSGGRLPGHGENLRVVGVTREFLDLLGVALVHGRTFSDQEHDAEGLVGLVSHDLAAAAFGDPTKAIGQPLTLEDVQRRSYTILGVLPSGFLFPDTREGPALLVPMREAGPELGGTLGDVQIIARLQGGMDTAHFVSQLRRVAAASEALYPKLDRKRETIVVPLAESLFGQVRQSTLVIFVGVVSIALLGCVTLYHTLAIQMRRRSRQLGVATALGATRARLLGELIAERVAIASLGAAGAVLLAHALRNYLLNELPAALAVVSASAEPVNARVLGFIVGLAFTFVTLTGSRPIQQALRNAGRQDWLKDRFDSRPPAERRTDQLLIVWQSLATFLVLMISVTVMRGLIAMGSQPLGFDYKTLRVVQPLPPSEYFSHRADSRAERTRAAYAQLKARFGSAIAANLGYPAGSTAGAVVASQTEGAVEVSSYRVTGDFFEVAGVQLMAGSTFSESESTGSTQKAVIDEVAAQKFWPGENPLGQFVSDPEDSRHYQVVGLVRTINRDLYGTGEPAGAVFLPFEKRWAHLPAFSYRATPEIRASEVAAIVDSVFPGALVPEVPLRPFRVQFHRLEFLTLLLGAIAVFDIVSVTVGVWSLIVHQLQADRHEIRVRMALGAPPARIMTMILARRVLLPVAAGIVLGGGLYWCIASQVAELTFKTPLFDAPSIIAAALVVAAVAVLPLVGPSVRLAYGRDLLRGLR